MFFDIFYALCKEKGVSCKKAAEEIGLSNSITTKWKKTGATPSGETLDKVAAYFGVSTDYLLGKSSSRLVELFRDAGGYSNKEETEKAPAESDKRSVSDDDIKFALFRGREEITDAMYQEVLNFAEYVARREEEKKKKE